MFRVFRLRVEILGSPRATYDSQQQETFGRLGKAPQIFFGVEQCKPDSTCRIRLSGFSAQALC